MTKAELTVILNKVGRVYGKTIDAEIVSSFNAALGNVPRFRVLRACMKLMQTGTYFPRPSEILSVIHKDTSAAPSPFDEACYWLMFGRGITDPGELNDADILTINQKVFGEQPV